MSFKVFCENIYGFLFTPSKKIEENMKNEEFKNNRFNSYIIVLYISVILGIAFWYFVHYPEPLYYGVSGEAFFQDMPTNLMPNSVIFLLIMIGLSVFIQFIFNFLMMGFLNYKVSQKISQRSKEDFKLKEYRNLYAYSFTPLLFWIPLFTFWIFFFERMIFLKPLYPMIDFTIPNLFLLSLVGFFLLWQFIIIIKINKVYFSLSRKFAIISVCIQVGILTVIFSSGFLLNDVIFNLMQGGLA